MWFFKGFGGDVPNEIVNTSKTSTEKAFGTRRRSRYCSETVAEAGFKSLPTLSKKKLIYII